MIHCYNYNLGGDRTGRTINDGTVTEIEDYTYDASFRLDNRGRPVLVTKDGVEVASYIYDDDEHREDKLGLPETGPFSRAGHREQIENKQRRLRTLLREALSKGCIVTTPDAWYWAT